MFVFARIMVNIKIFFSLNFQLFGFVAAYFSVRLWGKIIFKINFNIFTEENISASMETLLRHARMSDWLTEMLSGHL